MSVGVFYYNDVPHPFEIGMTWQQFMDSDYNFGLTTSDRWEKAGEGEAQQLTDTIENGAYYYSM